MALQSLRARLLLSLGGAVALILAFLTGAQALLNRNEARAQAELRTQALAREVAATIETRVGVALADAAALADSLAVLGSATSESLAVACRSLNRIATRIPETRAVGIAWKAAEPGANAKGLYVSRDETGEIHALPATFATYRAQSPAHQAASAALHPCLHYPVSIQVLLPEADLLPVLAPIVRSGVVEGTVEILLDTRGVWPRGPGAGDHGKADKALLVLSEDGRHLNAESQSEAQPSGLLTTRDEAALKAKRADLYYDAGTFKALLPMFVGRVAQPWYVLRITPASVLLHRAHARTWLDVGASAAILVLTLLVASLLIGRVARPLNAISRQLEHMSKGDLAIARIDTHNAETQDMYRNLVRLAESLAEVNKVCGAVAEGDFDRNVEMRGPHDELASAINEMSSMLRATAHQADAISQGDYSISVAPRSQRDRLGEALFVMTGRLREIARENNEQNWIKNGLAALDNTLRGDKPLDDLLPEALTCLVTHADAQMGALYLAETDGSLQLVQTHAYCRRKNMVNRLAVGEGLVGQSAREREPIVLTSVPEDYVSVQSSLGDVAPRNLIVVPLVYQESVKGVVELGSLQVFPNRAIEFLKQAAENLAVAVDSARSRVRLQALLKQTQTQSEELRRRQEELGRTNEELQEQTRTLRKSEQRLQTQQDELEHANAELEESSEALRRERNQVQKQNQELEKARSQLEEKARDLERTSKYKSEFLANMSHELRTPLNSLLILSKLLIDNKEGNLTEKQVDFARTINNAGNDLLQLINDILDLSKIESGKMPLNIDEVRLIDFGRGIEQNFRHVAEQRGLALRVNVQDGLPETIHTDEQRVGQIVKNLLSNAFKFTETGSVTMRIERPTIPNLPPHLQPDQSIAISVSDTGMGIPREKQQLIFEAFQQADGTTMRRFGGTGLGLSICRELTAMLAGEIHLESEPGQGSCFTVVLPQSIRDEAREEPPQSPAEAESQPTSDEEEAIETAPTPPAEPSEPTEAASAKPEFVPDDRHGLNRGDRSILIIDDDREFARILLDLAHEKGFQALVAGDGESGLHLADYYMPSAILLDLALPGIDGLSVVARLKENLSTRHIPVHIISGSEEPADAMRQGAVGFLRKPVNMSEADQAFQRIERLISHAMRELLVVEDDEASRGVLIEMLADEQVNVTAVGTGAEAQEQLKTGKFDCMILDLTLPDMSGREVLERLRENEATQHLPVIVFTGKDLSPDEQSELDRYAERVIVKGERSPERLLDETSLFLHRVENELPAEKQRIIEMLHDKEAILRDRKVLLVDDDMRNVFALTSVLEEKGLHVEVAKNGRESLEVLEKNPDVDLVVMDIMMPEMDGYEAMRHIRMQRQFHKLPIIALTAKAMKGDRAKCIEAGASDYLAKPVDTDKLISMMRVWLYR